MTFIKSDTIKDSTFNGNTFIPLSVSLWNDLGYPVFDGVGLAGFKSYANAFLLALLLAPLLSPTVFPFSSFIQWVGIVGLGSSD